MIEEIIKKGYKSLAIAAVGAGIALNTTGCATLPKPVKYAVTPIAVARDVIDIPLSTIAKKSLEYSENHLSDAGKLMDENHHKNISVVIYALFTPVGFGYSKNDGLMIAPNIPVLTSGAICGITGLADYVLCRSFCGENSNPYNKENKDSSEFLFPNLKKLWEEK